MMNFVGSFFGSFATAGALSRTILQDTSGGHTQVHRLAIYEDILVVIFLTYVVGWLCVIRNCFNCHFVPWTAI